MTEPGPDLLTLPWRTGRHVGRTVYAVTGDGASREDMLIGVMDTRELAAEVCAAHNAALGRRDEGTQKRLAEMMRGTWRG